MKIKRIKKLLKNLAIFILVAMMFLGGWPQIWNNLNFPPIVQKAYAVTCVRGTDLGDGKCTEFITATGVSTYTSPSDWDNSNPGTVYVYGAGGAGGTGSTTQHATGGGGGAVMKVTGVTFASPGTTSITYGVGQGGQTAGTNGGDTFWNRTSGSANSCADTSSACAQSGRGGSGGTGNQSGGAGGVTSSPSQGTAVAAGGRGGNLTGASGQGASGGGGAGGLSGAGNNGVDSTSTSAVATNGGQGDSTSGGAAGTSNSGNGGRTGGSGGNGTEWDATHGSGGGGGGGRSGNALGTGGTGGSFGGGGGGGSGSSQGVGVGGDGMIVVVYTPAAAGGPTQAVFTNASRTLTAGACSASFTVQLQNGGGTPTTPTGSTVISLSSNSSGTVTLYSDPSCTGGNEITTLSYTTSDTDQTFYATDTRKSPTTWTMTAHKTSGPDTISDGTQTYTVNAAAVSKLVIRLPGQSFTDGTGVSGSPTNQTAGSSFAITNIYATDAFFNVEPSSGYADGAHTLAYSGPSNAPDSTAPSYTTSVTFSGGTSTTTLTTTLFDAETTTITVTDGGNYGNASSSVTIDPGAINNYLVTISTPQTAGVCSTGSNSLTARDAWNNTRTTDTTTVDMTNSGTGITFYTTNSCGSSTSQYTMSSGTSNIYYKTNKKQTFTITATKTSDTPTGTSSTITVNAAAVSKLVIRLPGQSFTDGTGISGSPTNQTAGNSFTITNIYATDDFFNVESSSGYSDGAHTLAYSGPSNAPNSQAPSYTTSVSFTNGTSTTTLTTILYKAESTTITATDGGNYGNASSSVTVGAGSISADTSDSTVTGNSTVAINTPLTVTITLYDTWENPKVGITAAHITLVSTGGSFSQPSVDTDSNGQTTGTVQWASAGSKTVQVQISTDSLVQNDGSTADSDGFLDNTLAVTATGGGGGGPVNTSIKGTLRVKGNTRIN